MNSFIMYIISLIHLEISDWVHHKYQLFFRHSTSFCMKIIVVFCLLPPWIILLYPQLYPSLVIWSTGKLHGIYALTDFWPLHHVMFMSNDFLTDFITLKFICSRKPLLLYSNQIFESKILLPTYIFQLINSNNLLFSHLQSADQLPSFSSQVVHNTEIFWNLNMKISII